jgi:tRNA (guanine6-N2)-methyltransferase
MMLIATCTEGTEKIVLEELKRIGKVTEDRVSSGIVQFNFGGDFKELVKARTADDILFLIKKFQEINRYRSSLIDMKIQLRHVNLEKALSACSKVRKIETPTYNVKASYIGRRDYTAAEIEDTIRNEIKVWEESDDPEISVRVILTKDISLIGASLTKKPLYMQNKLKTVPGSLRPSLANVMLDLSGLKKDETFLDPMCGSGMIAIEGNKKLGARCIAGDKDKEVLEIAKQNAADSGAQVEFHEWDAKSTGLDEGSVDRIVSNLPFGKQLELEGDLINHAVKEMVRVLKKGGMIVLLSKEEIPLPDGVRLKDSLKITNSGIDLLISVIEKPI